CVFSFIPPPPSSTLFPYTTLFRSGRQGQAGGHRDGSTGRREELTTERRLRGANRRSANGSSGTRLAIRGVRSRSFLLGGFSVSRSEEHTSELQSLRHLVCRLLLEK